MEIIGTHHTSFICEPDRVSVAGITTETDREIIAFAVPHSHSGKLSSYWSTYVARYDDGTATCTFYKDWGNMFTLRLDNNAKIALESALENYLNGVGMEQEDEDEDVIEVILNELSNLSWVINQTYTVKKRD